MSKQSEEQYAITSVRGSCVRWNVMMRVHYEQTVRGTVRDEAKWD